MEQISAERSFLIYGHCLECNETRGSAVVIEELKQNADIRLFFPACGHFQNLAADEKKKMREALTAAGLI
jgi:hypothetical protein